jgi:hypothetical protein
MCRYVTQIVKFGDCEFQDEKQHSVERRLRSDWAASTLVPNDPCPLTKDDEGLCIEAKKEKKILASTRDEAGCPLCGIQA